jgi:pilus assembly protein CpaB
VPVAAGGYLTAGVLGGGGSDGAARPLRAGERALELAVAAGGALTGEPGSRVDVLVTSRREDGGGRTYVALENVELLGLRAGGDEGAAAEGASGSSAVPSARATLRVSARQAVYLTAAANFATEIRLLVRPPGDRKRIGAAAVAESGL